MNRSIPTLLDLAIPLHRDPFDDRTWGEALSAIGRAHRASSATLGVWSADTGALRDPVAYTWSHQVAELFFGRYHAYEPLGHRWKPKLPRLQGAGQHYVFTSGQLLPESWRSDDDRLFYEEFADPNGIGQVGGILAGDGRGQVIGLYLYRDDPFDEAELEDLRDAVDSLQGPIGRRQEERQRDALLHSLQRVNEANLFLDRSLHVHMHTEGSEALLQRAGFSLDAQGRLASRHRVHLQLVQCLLVGPGPRKGVLAGEQGPRFVVTVTPWVGRPQAFGSEPSTFHMRIHDLWAHEMPAAETLRGVFPDLTATEALVASWASTFLSRMEIAEKLGMSDRTVQAHLRNIYMKVGIHELDAAGDKNNRALLRRLLQALVDDR